MRSRYLPFITAIAICLFIAGAASCPFYFQSRKAKRTYKSIQNKGVIVSLRTRDAKIGDRVGISTRSENFYYGWVIAANHNSITIVRENGLEINIVKDEIESERVYRE